MDDVNINNDTSRLSYVLQSNHAYNTNKFKNCKVVLRKFMVYLTKLCKNCSGVFDSNDCYDGHLRSGVCNTAFICETCRGWVSSPDVVHICLGDKCIYCRKSVDLNHVHNGAGYDTHFIHEYMVRNGSYPEIITQGARIIFMCHTLQHYVL